MPWKTGDVDRFNKGLSRKDKRKWVAIANSSLKACLSKGGTDATCAPKAIQTANGVIKRDKEKEAAMKKPQLEPVVEIEEGSESKEIEEMYEDEVPFVPSGVVSFDQLDQLKATQEMSEKLRGLTGMYTQMVNNIVYWFEGDKVAQLRSVSDAFASRIQEILASEEMEEPELETTMQPPATQASEKFAESEAGEIISVDEVDLKEADDVLHLNVAIIRPGWGNKVDNHYYPAEMLQACAENFNGAKMYESDHRPEEKSTKTWVSTITEIRGFTDDGAPIARVAVHDPNFAERVKNLSKAGLLSKMECSILAAGTAEPNFELGGRKGKKVMSITDVESVDWVTRAGAGGRALELTEMDKKDLEGGGEMEMTTEETTVAQSEVETVETEKTTLAAPVTIEEAQEGGSTETTETTPSPLPEPEAETQDAAPLLGEVEVRSLLEASTLHPATIEKLLGNSYQDEAAVKLAIEVEKAYLAKVMEAGKVYGMGVSAQARNSTMKERQVAINEAADRVNSKFFGGTL